MRLLVDNNKNMYIVVSDRIYNEPIPPNVAQIDKDFDWDSQNPQIQTVEQAYQEWPDLRTIQNLKFVNANPASNNLSESDGYLDMIMDFIKCAC